MKLEAMLIYKHKCVWSELMDHGKTCPVTWWSHIPLDTFPNKQELFRRSSVKCRSSIQLSKKSSCRVSLTHKHHLLQHTPALLTLTHNAAHHRSG